MALDGRIAGALLAAIALTSGGLAHADGVRPEVGSGPTALAGVDHVAVLVDSAPKLAATATLGYGYTESVIDGDDSHHRAASQLALAYTLASWLGLAARIDGRLDAHAGSPDDNGAGFVGQSQLVARSSLPAAAGLRVGGEVALQFPGASDPGRGVTSTSAELRALATLSPPSSQLWLSGLLGFRLDRSSHGVADEDRLSLSDRVGLGASDSNALLLGLAVCRSLGPLDLLGEWSWDAQLGSDAPDPMQSPMRISAGVRWFPLAGLHVQLLGGVSPSARPDVNATGPLFPIEPRFWLGTGIGMYFPGTAKAAVPVAAAKPAPAPSPPAPARLRGRVVDAAGRAPLPGVTLDVPGRPPITTDAQGGFALDDLPPGELALRAHAPGFRDVDARATLAAGATAQLELALERELPDGQISGTVRSFDGKPLAARIRVDPLGKTIEPRADGSFEIDVAPGEYTVVVSAPGHLTQERPALVEHNGVTVIIVELSRTR